MMVTATHNALHVFYILVHDVHFFVVLSKTTMWNDQIQSVMENANTQQWIFLCLSELEHYPYRLHVAQDWIVWSQFTNWPSWYHLACHVLYGQILENSRCCILNTKDVTGLSLRFQVAGHMKLVGRVPSIEAASIKQLGGGGTGGMPS